MSRLQQCSSPHAEKNAVTRTRISATANKELSSSLLSLLKLETETDAHAHYLTDGSPILFNKQIWVLLLPQLFYVHGFWKSTYEYQLSLDYLVGGFISLSLE